MIQFSRSMQPLLIGSVVLLSLACRQDDRSNPSATTPETGRSSENSQYAPPPSAGTQERSGSTDLSRNQATRDQMNGDDMNRERMPVAGRDDAIELGNGGSSGMGGKSGTGGSHH